MIPTFSTEEPTQLRISCPEGYEVEKLEIQLQSEDGSWRAVDSRVKGSYVVFAVSPTDTGICLIYNTANYRWITYVVVGVAAVVLIAGVVIYRKKKAKTEQAKPVGTEV